MHETKRFRLPPLDICVKSWKAKAEAEADAEVEEGHISLADQEYGIHGGYRISELVPGEAITPPPIGLRIVIPRISYNPPPLSEQVPISEY